MKKAVTLPLVELNISAGSNFAKNLDLKEDSSYFYAKGFKYTGNIVRVYPFSGIDVVSVEKISSDNGARDTISNKFLGELDSIALSSSIIDAHHNGSYGMMDNLLFGRFFGKYSSFKNEIHRNPDLLAKKNILFASIRYDEIFKDLYGELEGILTKHLKYNKIDIV